MQHSGLMQVISIKPTAIRPPNPSSEFISERDAARRIGLAVTTLRRWRWEGRNCPPHTKLGTKLVKYWREGLERWLEDVRAGRIIAGSRDTEGAA